MSHIDWNKAREIIDSDCQGLRVEWSIVDENDGEPLPCHETGQPVQHWCDTCIGWVAVCELATQQMAKGGAK